MTSGACSRLTCFSSCSLTLSISPSLSLSLSLCIVTGRAAGERLLTAIKWHQLEARASLMVAHSFNNNNNHYFGVLLVLGFFCWNVPCACPEPVNQHLVKVLKRNEWALYLHCQLKFAA